MPLLVEAGWGGLVQLPWTITWTDITTFVDVVKQGVVINRGASDELSDTQPGTAVLWLDDSDGRFTPGSPGPYSPFVRPNAPIRISVAVIPTTSGSAPYPLAMLGDDFDDGRVNTTLWPTNTGGAGTETGEGRLRIQLVPGVDTNFTSARQWNLAGSKLTAKLAAVPALNGSSNCAASMWVTSTTAGTRLGWRYDAGTGVISAQSQSGFADGAAVNLTYSAIDHAWLRVRESGGTVTWETSGDGYGWTVRRTLATPAWVTSQTHAVDFPTTRTGGATGYIDWDLVGADVRPRFWGVVNEFPVSWKGLIAQTKITCTDLFKRLNRWPTLKSALAEEILHPSVPGATTSLAAYYPLTEPTGATSVGDIAGGGCGALALTQVSSGGALDFGSDGLAETGDTSATFAPASASAGKYLTGDLGPGFQAAMNSAYLHVEFWFKSTSTSRAILGMYEPSLDHQMVYALSASGELTVEYTDSGGALSVHNSAVVLNDGNWHHVVQEQFGSPRLYIDGVASTVQALMPAMSSLRTLHVGGYRGARLFAGQIAHVAITLADTDVGSALSSAHYEAGITGFSGEAADVRIERLAKYAGLSSVTVWGGTFDPIASQGPGGSSVMARMREVEATESARLFAERDYYGLAFQSRDLRYNPDPANETFTIDYADLETGDVELALDDQKLVNSIEASRPDGATQRVTAPSSIAAFGTYDPGALNILKTTDNSVLDAAYWRVSRYADPQTELREVPIEAYTMAAYLDILDADISSYFSVNNMPSQAPASSIRCTVEGYAETIKQASHRIQFHTSATSTDTVWVLDDPTYSVLGTTTRLAY
ncbi:LamG-like jellyroll fold domain-containing protein [Streptomyces sp. NPDC050263]|uniref:LamG-like jellyroll fold domain-containing protein n=1 Tax=Streptomyces sp. NPDC050263 TaxID=3155037 RepID=UPI003423ED7F